MPSVTVYVDLKGMPHAFLGLNDGQGGETHLGWAPDANGYRGRPVAPGKVGEGLTPTAFDQNYAGNMDQVAWKKTIEVSDAQFAAMQAEVDRWRDSGGQYVVTGNNCTNLVRSTLAAGGVSYDGTTSGPHPVNLIPEGERSTYLELYWPPEGIPYQRWTDVAENPTQHAGTPAYDHVNGQQGAPASPPDPSTPVDWDGVVDASDTTPVSWTSSDGEETVRPQDDGTVEHEILRADGSVQQDVLDIRDAYDYARTSNIYDDGWGLLDRQTVTWDDGTRTETDWDQKSEYEWRTQTAVYKRDLLDTTVVYSDYGGAVVTDLDQEGNQAWRMQKTTYDSSGLLDKQKVDWDAGTVSETDWDQAGEQTWATQMTWWDGAGRLDSKAVVSDAGTTTVTDPDQDASQTWNVQLATYDEFGRFDSNTVYWCAQHGHDFEGVNPSAS